MRALIRRWSGRDDRASNHASMTGGKRTYAPDPKRPKRVKNPAAMKQAHARGVTCVLCGKAGSLHHVYPRGQGGDDVPENLIGLCGSGTTGEHGLIEANDPATRKALGAFILSLIHI